MRHGSVYFEECVEVAQDFGQVVAFDAFGFFWIECVDRHADARKKAGDKFWVDACAIGDGVGGVSKGFDVFDHFPEVGVEHRFAFALQGDAMWAAAGQSLKDVVEKVHVHMLLVHLATGAVEAAVVADGGDFDLDVHECWLL